MLGAATTRAALALKQDHYTGGGAQNIDDDGKRAVGTYYLAVEKGYIDVHKEGTTEDRNCKRSLTNPVTAPYYSFKAAIWNNAS
jgi:hypothetical protein